MNEQELAEVVRAIAGEAISASADLWPAVAARLTDRPAQRGNLRPRVRDRALLLPQAGLPPFARSLFLLLGIGLLLLSWALYTQWTTVERFIAVQRGEEHLQQVGWLLHRTAEESTVRPAIAAVFLLLGVAVIAYVAFSSPSARSRAHRKVKPRRNK